MGMPVPGSALAARLKIGNLNRQRSGVNNYSAKKRRKPIRHPSFGFTIII